VIFDQLRGKPERIAGSDGTVGPDLDRQFVVIGDLPETRRFDGVVALADGGVHGIDGNEPDAEVVLEIAVGGNVAAAAFEAHFHVELAAFAYGCDVDLFVENLDIAIGFDGGAGDHSRLVGAQIDRLGAVAGKLERDLLQVEDDVGRVFDHAGNRLELVEHAFDLDR